MRARRQGRWAIVRLFGVTALVAGLGGPATAGALPGPRNPETPLIAPSLPAPPGFELRATDGFTFQLAMLGAGGSSGSVAALILVRGRSGSVSYLAPATATAESFDVDLGELGHIEVAFHATGGSEPRGSTCGTGAAPAFAAGYYEGAIAFHGEEGYTSVEASRARGDARPALDLLCPGSGSSGSGPGLPGAELRVRGRRGSSTPSLTVVENNRRAPVQLEVNAGERRGEIAIERTVRIRAPRTAFRYDRRLRRAVVRPPAPFTGAGRFRRTAHGPGRWIGNLSVDMPGRSEVPLTGGRVQASLSRARFKGSGPIG